MRYDLVIAESMVQSYPFKVILSEPLMWKVTLKLLIFIFLKRWPIHVYLFLYLLFSPEPGPLNLVVDFFGVALIHGENLAFDHKKY